MNIKHFPELEQELWDLFNKHDPIGLIRMGAPPDEYESEVEMVMKRVSELTSIKAAQDIIYSVFQKMFSRGIAGTSTVYTALASELVQLLKREKLIS